MNYRQKVWYILHLKKKRIGEVEPVPPSPDISDIDMTATLLDSRVRYQCASSHAYYGSDGQIHYAAPDEYPLEYINGVAVGRHEPEPQSTNLVKNNTLTSLATGWGGNRVIFAPGVIIAPDGTTLTTVGKYNAANVNSGLFYRTNDSGDIPAVASGFSIVPVQSRAFIESLVTPDYKYMNGLGTWQRWVSKKTSSPASGYSGTIATYSTVTAVIDALTAAWAWQFESGRTFSTSPILTYGAAVTRATGFLLIKTQGLPGCVMYFSNGDTTDVIFDNSEWVQLPESSLDWGTRYITRIEYKNSLSAINLLTEQLDNRLRFTCASEHAYYGKDGRIHYAGPDECPVEYINGIAVGRHEPEAQSTNYLRFSGAYYTAYRCYYQYNQQSPDGLNSAVNIVTTTVNNGASFCDADNLVGIECTTSIIAKHVSGACNWVFKQEGNPASDIIFTPVEKTFARKRRTFNPPLYSGHVRMSLLNYGTLAVEDKACSFHRQMEQGKIATSPIKESTVFTTRSAAFLLVKMNGAAGIRVRYTTGNYDEYQADGEEWFQLPWSNYDWGTRYIQTIEYIL